VRGGKRGEEERGGEERGGNIHFQTPAAVTGAKLSEITPKNMFSAPNLFGEGPPNFGPSFFEIAPFSDHVAKFRGDRPRDRGDLALNKKKQQQNIRARPGGPN